MTSSARSRSILITRWRAQARHRVCLVQHPLRYETEANEWGARAERDAKALTADPSLAEATLAMASAAGTLHGAFNWPVVIADATRALAIDRWSSGVVRMRAFFHLGLFDRMADEARAAYR